MNAVYKIGACGNILRVPATKEFYSFPQILFLESWKNKIEINFIDVYRYLQSDFKDSKKF